MLAGTGFYLANNIYLRDGHVVVPGNELERPIPPEQLREDLSTLILVFEETHIDFAAVNGTAYIQAVTALRDSIDRPMSRLEFYRVLAPLNGLISDGHTDVMRPAEELASYERSGGLYLPLLVQIRGNQIAVSREFAPGHPLIPGDLVTAINGISSETLSQQALAHQSGENIALRQVYAERSFYRNLPILGVQSPFIVEYVRDGEARQVSFDGVTRPAYVERRETSGGPGNAYEILGDGIALLTFAEMPSQMNEFRRFVDAAFAAFAEQGVETLILDIRTNGGGDSRAGDLLMRYIADQDYPGLESVDVRVTARIKDYYRTLLPPAFRWLPLNRFVPILRQIETAEPGSIFSVFPDGETPLDWERRPDNAFTGNLFVLIGPATYSSAAIFAAPLSHYDQATFVGEETGEPMVFYGENYIFDLPNSRIQAVVSHKRFDLVGDGDNRTGIIPDVAVEADNALVVAMQIANGERLTPNPAQQYGEITNRIIEIAEASLFDPRIISSDAWVSFRQDLLAASATITSDAGLVEGFESIRGDYLDFSHFELRLSGTSSESGVQQAQSVFLERIDERTSVLRIDRFMGDGVSAALTDALNAIIEQDVDHLVIDLRGNPGGDFSAWPIGARLIGTPTQIAAISTAQWIHANGTLPDAETLQTYTTTRSPDRASLMSDLMDDGLIVLEVMPELPQYSGSVSVLIDSDTASTSELVAAVLQSSGRARLFGERTAGEVLNAQLINVSDSLSLIVPIADVQLPNGDRLEGMGVEPDEAVTASLALQTALARFDQQEQ
ncbi:S41 family peptidase [Hyphobacterium sp.]|uniref:S41 family peptidase n=1 Tax=Hyphobacterium sp. TaxID=2004662 RepID=UPI003748AA6F